MMQALKPDPIIFGKFFFIFFLIQFYYYYTFLHYDDNITCQCNSFLATAAFLNLFFHTL